MAENGKTKEQRDIEDLRAGAVGHVGVPLWRASHAFVGLMMAGYRALGYDDLSESHTTLLPHLDVDGTRITEIAARAGLTKQAIGQMVSDLEDRGYVLRAADPSDARAKIVRYTAKGRRFMRDGWAIKRDLHERCRDIVGAQDFEAFVLHLETLADSLDAGEKD
ncbi:MAG: winged helix-turn-helix transcriptional regulator [Alphaproteobacteria bacterium]|nr:winged helix-turn-helix transcriptional regulator [Alphaproteobacteria bacterium]